MSLEKFCDSSQWCEELLEPGIEKVRGGPGQLGSGEERVEEEESASGKGETVIF